MTGVHNLVAGKGVETWRTSNLAVTGARQPVAVRCAGVDDTKALADAVTAARNSMIVIETDQLCAVKEIILPNVRVEKGGLLKPLTSHTITITGVFEAGAYQTFINAKPGEGTISFQGNRTLRELYPEWWGASGDAAIDSSAAVQAAINASQTVSFPASDTGGVPIQFGVGEYRFDSGVNYSAPKNASIVLTGRGYSTVFVAGRDITILTLNQGNSSNHGMTIAGIHFNLNGKDAAAIDLNIGGQMAHLEDIWVLNPSATGTKKLIQIGGEVVVIDRVMVAGTGSAGALKNSNVGIYLTHVQPFRIWVSHVMVYLLQAGLAVDNRFASGATFTVRDSSLHGNNVAIDIGAIGDAANGVALFNWLIEGNQFESNLTHINLRGFSAQFPLANVTIADNYFTGIDKRMVAIRAENVAGLSVLRNFFKNGTASDHTGVALSLAGQIRGARLSANASLKTISPSMTIVGNETSGINGGPVFATPLLTFDQNSIDLREGSM